MQQEQGSNMANKHRAGVGKIRIVGGSLRGSRIEVADSQGLRPTSDRARETLYNWLAPWIEGMRCLDLYAGSGALGIEALSRGAAECVFIERDRGLATALRETLVRLQQAQVKVVNADALSWLQADAVPFDLVLLDPPFEHDFWQQSVQALEQNGWLAADAWIYVEAPLQRQIRVPANWILHRELRTGAVHSALYRRRANDRLS